MLKLALIALGLFTIYFSQSDAVENPKVVCYYESWGFWRQGRGKMTVNDIDSSLCTHIVYAYFSISDSYKVGIMDPYLMEDLHDLSNFAKKKGSSKALIAIGGSAQSSKYSLMASTDHDRITFVDSVIELLRKYNFDGVMIDWQYPTAHDRDNYVKLLDKFDEKFSGTPYTLGITASPVLRVIDDGYDVHKIINYVDFVHVLTFDLHGPWDTNVNHAAPLEWQIESLNHWWSKGVPKHMLLMSIPLFARTWTLSKMENRDIKAEAMGPGTAGPYTQAAGMLSYNELCSKMKEYPSEWVLSRDPLNIGVYAVHGKEWVSFEDSRTCADKAKNITTDGYGGIVAYALTNEDFHGDCSGTKYPLLHGINSGLNHNPIKESTPPTEPPRVTNTPSHVTSAPGSFHCHAEGKFVDPLYCQKYHVCVKSDIPGVWEDNILYCADNKDAFDGTSQKCIKKELVPGCHA